MACVERIMLLKLGPAQSRAEAAREAVHALSHLPDLLHISVGLPADAASEKSWDVSVVLRFADLPALTRALASAAFQAFERTTLGECAVVKAWNFAPLEST